MANGNSIDKYPYFADKNTLIEIMDNSFGTLFVTDGEGNIIFFSESQVRNALQLEPKDLLGKNINVLYSEGFADRAMACAEVIKAGKPVATKLRNQNRAKGMFTDRVIVCNPVFDEGGNLKMTVGYSMEEHMLDSVIQNLIRQKENADDALTFMYEQKKQSVPLISKDPVTMRAYDLAKKVARLDTTVIIYGESGAGKDVMARYLHANSPRADKVFLPVNSAALPNELIESELFGYEKGSFTGANKGGKSGLFEIANDGTIFLDEIAEIPYSTQSKLLRVLENGEYFKVGGNQVHVTNARIIAATNRDLIKMVKEGKFREDLYYRLDVMPITVPPLRLRKDDIIDLANSFLDKCNQKYHRKQFFSERTIASFLNYNWPGNVRELRNIVERLALTTDDDCINAEVGSSISRKVTELPTSDPVRKPSVFMYGESYKEAMRAFEKEYIEAVIAKCGGNITAAAKELQIHRTSLYKKLAADADNMGER